MKRDAPRGFEDFRALAKDASLNPYEKIDAPESYRRGREGEILADIVAKLPALNERGRSVLEVGPGCTALPGLLMEHCLKHGHRLVMVDSAEMLDLLPDVPHVEKVAACFPDCPGVFTANPAGFDAILVYSVIQYVFVEANLWDFFDRALSLLAPGGAMLLGDIPNISKRKRYFSSEEGIRRHMEFMKTDEPPGVSFNTLERERIDDAVVLSLVLRARLQGFDAYLVPQPPELPMATRREDLLVTRP